MRIIARMQDSRREERLLLCQIDEHRAKLLHTVRSYENRHFQWTRRLIALIAVSSIIVLPKLIAIFLPEVAIHIGYPQLMPGFLFFSSDIERIKWVSMQGLVITPLDTHLLSAIIGLYFGGSLIGPSR